jgi:formylmethanofuran dehydrogenase subunit E
MMDLMWPCCLSLPVLFLLSGCAGPRPTERATDLPAHEEPTMLHHYQPEAADPDWLIRAGEFHGHLGPWLVLGSMIGQDALKRLDTDGYWNIEITVWLPPQRQRQPWSCILDGLQVSTGATLGKQNIRMAFSPEVTSANRPAVFVVRRETASAPRAGYAYRLKPQAAAELASLRPDRLEGLSRDIANRTVSDLFEVQPLPDNRLGPEQE